MLNLNFLFDLSHSLLGEKMRALENGYEAIFHIKEWISELSLDDSYERRGGALISKKAHIDKSAKIGDGVIICEGAEIRHGAFLRENAIVGCGAVIGNSYEIKNSIIFDEAQIPHFNYVGDSIIGYRAHLGAGVICSNLRSDKGAVRLRIGDEIIDTGARKLGALVGDEAEIGCNCVLCPGTIIARSAMIYPLSLVRGYVEGVFKGFSI